jgi:Na+-driven multidrug efflux pump
MLLQEIAMTGLRIYFIGCIFAGFNIILSIYFTSTEKPRPAHVISLLRGFFVIIPTVFILSELGDLIGVWFAFPVTEIIVAALGLVLFFRLNKFDLTK